MQRETECKTAESFLQEACKREAQWHSRLVGTRDPDVGRAFPALKFNCTEAKGRKTIRGGAKVGQKVPLEASYSCRQRGCSPMFPTHYTARAVTHDAPSDGYRPGGQARSLSGVLRLLVYTSTRVDLVCKPEHRAAMSMNAIMIRDRSSSNAQQKFRPQGHDAASSRCQQTS